MPLKQLAGYMAIPDVELGFAGSFTSTLILDGANEKAAGIFMAPKTGSIAKIGFTVSTYTSGATVDVRLETVDATTGDPTGTLVGSNTNNSFALAAAGYYLVTLDAAASVNKGDVIAVVIAFGATPGNFVIGAHNIGTTNFPYCDLYTGAWTKAGNPPAIALEYSDGSYSPGATVFPGAIAYTSVSFNNTSSPDEIGLMFQLPFPVRVTGFWFRADLDGDADFVLYDEDGVTALLTKSMDKDVRATTATAIFSCMFNGSAILKRNKNYRIVAKPSSATSIAFSYRTVANLAATSSLSGGQLFQYTSAKDPTGIASWTQNNARHPTIGILVDQFHDGQVSDYISV